MSKPRQQKLILVSFVYWFLLLYMIAALAWWFIALENQNDLITQIKWSELKKDDPAYFSKFNEIQSANKRKTTQYIGEGVTFLVLILIGAIFVFRATRRQLKSSVQQQNFMMAITHELKTPIAVTQLNLETLQKHKLDELKQQKLISNTLQEANRLNSLCNNILFAAQFDGGKYTTAKQHLNLTDLLETSVDECKNRFPTRLFEEQLQADIVIDGDSFLLQMLINNLLENAIKYSPKDKAIQVVLSKKAKTVKLEIIDAGIGIQDEEKKNVFKKFYRIGDENTRRAQGTGLGLYLCKKIAEAHGASIAVGDNHPSGSNFNIQFNA
jgi:two-component system, OmpR family, sensor histidine kinase CiaH